MHVQVVNLLNASREELKRISDENLLSLNVEEMEAVQNYFKGVGRNPTDVELNTIAQTWSEHCYHKTFKGLIKIGGEVVDSLFKTYIFKATYEMGKEWCLNVFKDNAGIIEFDDVHAVAFKVETHNHPTALDPYGGAGTGSGGVFRDVMGVGAKPILSTNVLFFGPLNFPHKSLPKGIMHPKRVMKGAVAGIRDYGNRMGIPTANGAIGFDEGYLCNPLVFAGCVGIMPKNRYVKEPKPGHLIVLAGGRTGRDGIRGVTFASVELTDRSETTYSGAVQIGNPIVEKKLLDALLRARDEGDKPLYSAVTDCGGGGLSSAVGEMGRDIGATVELDRVPLKYSGLKPWEIWVSESQERMLLAVPRENLGRLMEIFEEEDCEVTVIGEFTDSGKLVLKFKGEVVANLDMTFLHQGVPRVVRVAEKPIIPMSDPPTLGVVDLCKTLREILSAPNVASKEWVIRQYDHEVQAHTIVKPICGVGEGPSDACVLKPLDESWRGIVVSNGVNPRYSSDPYNMALSAVDEAVRNNVCCGGRRIALLDNFSWGNPEKPELLGQLVEAARGCYEAAKGFDTPFISGKDSLYNEYVSETGESRAIPPTLLISAVGLIPDVRKAVTADLKSPGNLLYIVGETKRELGGSHYYMVTGVKGGRVPTVDLAAARKAYDAIVQAIDLGLVEACHDCSEGGLAVAASEMAIAGDLGLTLHLRGVPRTGVEAEDEILFSESNSRLLLEVREDKASMFERVIRGVKAARVGWVTEEKNLKIIGLKGHAVLEESVSALRNAWKSTFNWWMT